MSQPAFRALAVWTCLLALLSVGCGAASRHRVLTLFFDGVPPPKAAPPVAGAPGLAPGPAAPARRAGGGEHGPYAAKLCTACHEVGAANGLVAPKEELCFRCHELDLNKRFIHGPLASGGCLLCHDPHSSRYRSLLLSESDTFCVRCHDRQDLAKSEGHGEPREACTTCHDGHGSDAKYLLK